jgi:hypothetical protein
LFFTDADCELYLELSHRHFIKFQVDMAGYTLMANHILCGASHNWELHASVADGAALGIDEHLHAASRRGICFAIQSSQTAPWDILE